jgi:isochorismate synthase
MIHHDAVTGPARQLIDDYRVGMPFFLSSPQRTLLAEGIHAAATSRGGMEEWTRFPRRAAALLDEVRSSGHGAPVIVGAVPFDYRTPVRLVVPERVRWAEPLRFFEPVQDAPPLVSAGEIREVPPPQKYMRAVEQGLTLLQAGELEKVVLSRSMQFTSKEPVAIPQLLRNLARHHSNGYTFAVDLPPAGSRGDAGEGERRTLIGASPELLVSRSGLQVTANPLAGSRARSEDPAEDRRRAAELFESAKDRHEHAVVVEAVSDALRPYCRRLEVPAAPSLVQTETMWHLSTRIVGELKDSSTSSLQLATALHPTPAVCGTPTDLAKAAIRALEPFDRGFYTGMVGWMDAGGDGEWVVAIRCAEVEGRLLRLFAGAGIVVGSRPEEELAETSAKFRTMLRAMGLDREPAETDGRG